VWKDIVNFRKEPNVVMKSSRMKYRFIDLNEEIYANPAQPMEVVVISRDRIR
jgi:hypothetical protein